MNDSFLSEVGFHVGNVRENLECRYLHNVNDSEQCIFVNSTKDCYVDESLIQYTIFIYCGLGPQLVPLAIIILIFWLLMLFVSLAVVADNFFCPSLEVIAIVMHMSENIAGVTLLAFGNGAPDVFSAISAVNNMKDGDVGLVFGALLGAGVFLTTVVVGAVTLVGPFRSMQRPLLRDMIFYIATIFMTFYIYHKGSINFIESLVYLVGYAVYVVVVIVSRLIYQWQKRINHLNSPSIVKEEDTGTSDEDDSIPRPALLVTSQMHSTNDVESGIVLPQPIAGQVSLQVELVVNASAEENRVVDNNSSSCFLLPCSSSSVNADSELIDSETTPLLRSNHSNHSNDVKQGCITKITSLCKMKPGDCSLTAWKEFLLAISPIIISEWMLEGDKYFLRRIFAVFKAPGLFLFRLTVPLVDDKCPKNNWNKHLNMLHCVITPVFTVFALRYQFALERIGNVLPVWVIVLLIGVLAACIVFFTSCRNEPPAYHRVFAFIGFFASVMWIKNIANEVVNILQSAGVVFGVSNLVLGLTFLAWGNSVPDLICDVAVAKIKRPRVGLSACFGGPLFNTLLGIGFPFAMATYTYGTMHIVPSPVGYFLFVGLACSLISSLILIPLCQFYMKKPYAIFLICLYIVFLIVALLIESKVINWRMF